MFRITMVFLRIFSLRKSVMPERNTLFRNSVKGITLIESLVGMTVFLIIALSVYQSFARFLEFMQASRTRTTATALANEQFEIIRNLPYADVGLVAGIPLGKIPHTQTVTRDNIDFVVSTFIRNIDDPFDGTISSTPSDLSPADYKLAQIEIVCPSCRNFSPLRFTTYVAPKNLETASNNGALFVRVFDANGQPVQGADIHIENNQVNPPIVIDEISNNQGELQIVDAPPGVEAYEIQVSKSGYSQDQTYPVGAFDNPNPTRPHATVALQQVTQTSFAIDTTSVLETSSLTKTCAPVSNVDFLLKGSKLIGMNPDVLKYDQVHATDGSGETTIADLEWDTYNLSLNDALYDLAGAIPLVPLSLTPNTAQELKLIVAPKDPNALLVTIKDAGTQLPVSGAQVRLESAGYDETLITGRGFLRQTEWSGGAGQEDFLDPARYFDSDGNIETGNPAGEFHLAKVFSDYAPAGVLTSSTFDTGSASNFHNIIWQPQAQPLETGLDSARFQIATNNDKATWNFLGPDGTSGTFYTLADTNVNSLHNGDRYLRYRVFLQTADVAFTPTVADAAFTFTSSCVPPGQVLFGNLGAGDYTLTVSHDDYQSFNNDINVSASWQQYEVTLVP